MASFGRISNSLVTGVNENTIALASLNFDFSLFKVEAPQEYSGVGHALAKSRRESAESGTTHRTARKLGALFEGVVPKAPGLVAAYGTRASEIIQKPGCNPAGKTEHHGPFTAFVGADATSIWAAATSGGTSIAVHLLACLLGRAFTDPAHSTSVWAELVQERQCEILRSSQGPMLDISQLAAVNAASQPIPRDELQQWDASARAWLQTADSAMQKDHCQLKLILRSTHLPVSAGGSLYTNVVRSWTQAMGGLERLINGQPQSVTDGAILLAISAWHLYPDLIVLGGKLTNIPFSDSLIPPAALLTVGITNSRDCSAEHDSSTTPEGIYWSVALSHYRYYGRPLETSGEIDDRLSIDELHLVALGSLLQLWKVSRSEIESSAPWFVALWSCVNQAKSSLPRPKWLENISLAAKSLLDATGQMKRECFSLVDFGHRRARGFLVPTRMHDQSCLPWFGLRSPHILDSLRGSNPQECGVRYLRQLARAMRLLPGQAIITQISHISTFNRKIQHHEYTTAVLPYYDFERRDDRIPENVPDLINDDDSLSSRSTKRKAKHSAGDGPSSHYADEYVFSTAHTTWAGSFSFNDDDKLGLDGTFPSTWPEARFGIGQYTAHPDLNLRSRSGDDVWYQPETLSHPLRCDRIASNGNSIIADCQADLPEAVDIFGSGSVHFYKMIGDSSGALRLWMTRLATRDKFDIQKALDDLQLGKSGDLVSIQSAIEALESETINHDILWQYLEGPDPYMPDTFIKPFLELIRTERQQCKTAITSLRSLAVAKSIYSQLSGAKILASIVQTGIHGAKWAELYHSTLTLTRSIVFSCIAMFETGKIDLDAEKLEQVIALSSGNSLFVASRLLEDPNAEKPEHAVSRIVGNIGRSGISLLIPPPASPLVRPLSNSFRAVSYPPFDGVRGDSFKGTSFHLSFTSNRFPLDYGMMGIQDHQVYFVESVISVHDGGQWVADLDALRVLGWESGRQRLSISRRACTKHSAEERTAALENFAAVESWEEVLDTPPGIGLVKAHRNWPARLAACAVLEQLGDGENASRHGSTKREERGAMPRIMILDNGDELCWACVYRRFKRKVTADTGAQTYLIT